LKTAAKAAVSLESKVAFPKLKFWKNLSYVSRLQNYGPAVLPDFGTASIIVRIRERVNDYRGAERST
jgi:hypothetical protein